VLKGSLKILVSLWILYHLVGILIMPSPQSILVKNWAWLFRPYLNSLTINTTWNLFSPDPGTASYLLVNLISDQEETGLRSFTWPRAADKFEHDFRYRREWYMTRYLLADENRVHRFLIPWLCRKNLDVQDVQLQLFSTFHPSLEVASTMREYIPEDHRVLRVVKETRAHCADYRGEL